MISRVADHCFWLGRYIERAESTARVLSATRYLALDGELTARQCWQPVLIVAGASEDFVARHGAEAMEDGEAVQRYLSLDLDNPVSLRRSVGAARENARSIREVVSLEIWEALNEVYLWVHGQTGQAEFEARRYAFYRRVRNTCQLCAGVLEQTMLHDTPLDFIMLGLQLERVNQTARFLDVHHHALSELGEVADDPHGVVQTALWLSLLRACSGFEPFMKRHQGRVTGATVASFLLLEPAFPRSVRHCVRSAYQRLCAIRPPDDRELPGGQVLERLRTLDAWLEEKTKDSLEAGEVHDLLTEVVDETSTICTDLGRELLGHDVAPGATAAGQ